MCRKRPGKEQDPGRLFILVWGVLGAFYSSGTLYKMEAHVGPLATLQGLPPMKLLGWV